MKNKKKSPISESGIEIADDISLSIPKQKALPEVISLIIIAFFGITGIVNAFATMFQLEFSTTLLNLYCIFAFLLFSIIFILPKKFMVSLVPILLIYQLLIYGKWENYKNGFQSICNQIYHVVYPKRSDYFRIDIDKIDIQSDTSLFLSFTIFLLTGLICYFTIVKPNFILGFTLTFPILEIGLYHGKSPSLLTASMVIIYWTSLLSIDQSGYSSNLGRSKTGFIREYNNFTAKPIIKFRTAGQSGIIVLISSGIIISAIVVITNMSGYSRSDKINQMRSDVKIAVNEFTFDDIGGSLQKLSASFGFGNFSSNSHRLGTMSSVSPRGNKCLTIISSGNDIPNNHIYLKSYVGSVYDGKSWSEHDDAVYNSISWDKENSPQNTLYNSYGNKLRRYKELYPTEFSLNIEPTLFNTKYNYVPYNSYPRNSYECIDDTVIKLNAKKSYTFDVSYYQNFEILFEEDNIFRYYDNYEYNEFVHKNYLDVPNNADTEKLYNLFINGMEKEDTLSTLNYIKSVLDENASYTLSPGKTPSDKDFVTYFLTENHKGYCMHFATSGVILARMAGIPARYAEGYVVFKKDFNEKNKYEDGYRIEISDVRAHAWAEIYVDGCGWIPFEFTPSSSIPIIDSFETETTEKPVTTVVSTSATSTITLSEKSRLSNKNISNISVPRNSENKNTTSNITLKLSSELKVTLAIISVIVIFSSIIIIVHIIVIKKRIKSFNTGNYSVNTLNAYNYIIELLEFCNISNQNMQYLEFAEFVENKHQRMFRNNEFSKITDAVLEAAMSGKEISAEKSEFVIKSANKLAVSIFRRKNIFGRIYMKFIKNLY